MIVSARVPLAARAAAGAAALAFAIASGAQSAESAWPSRPVRIVVAQAPGGPPDRIARFVADPLSRALGVPVVVDNRPGASGFIGVEQAMRSAPDGHTLLVATLSTHVLAPAVAAHAPADALERYEPVINLHRSIKALWIHASLPPRTLPEFVDWARRRPRALDYASGGVGSSNHVDMEVLRELAAFDAMHVPYNGPAAAIAAVAAGDVQAMIVSVTTGAGPAQSGRVRPLAVFAADRSPLYPEVPTAAEQGYAAIELSAWIGLVAPAGTPTAIVRRLNEALDRAIRSPEGLAWAAQEGLEIIGGPPAAFTRTIESDRRRWRDRLTKSGLAVR
ncbi:MAG: tripartite tricarboxylate transporter substrate binding protein [Burkholderiales bacterium]